MTLSALLAGEYGLIENLTAFCFAISAALALIVYVKNKSMVWAVSSYVMCLAFMREMDLHKAWTTDSILKSRFYLREDVPFFEKAIGILVIVSIVFCVVYLLRQIPHLLKNLKDKKISAYALILSGGLIVTSKFFDSMARVIPPLEDFKDQNALIFKALEEGFELFAAIAIVLICVLKILGSFRLPLKHTGRI
jgi:hypothetical protein